MPELVTKMDIHQILKNVWLPPTTGPVSAELYIMTCCYIGCWEVADKAHFLDKLKCQNSLMASLLVFVTMRFYVSSIPQSHI